MSEAERENTSIVRTDSPSGNVSGLTQNEASEVHAVVRKLGEYEQCSALACVEF